MNSPDRATAQALRSIFRRFAVKKATRVGSVVPVVAIEIEIDPLAIAAAGNPHLIPADLISADLVSQDQIRYVLDASPKTKTERLGPQLLELRAAGVKWAEIAKRFGESSPVLEGILRRYHKRHLAA